jgi:hypothetical protein
MLTAAYPAINSTQTRKNPTLTVRTNYSSTRTAGGQRAPENHDATEISTQGLANTVILGQAILAMKEQVDLPRLVLRGNS